MKTSVLCLSFLLSLTSLTLTSEEEELRQINLGQIGPTFLQLLTAAGLGAGTAALAGALSGGGGKGKGLFGGKGLFDGKGLFGGKHGKHGKGKKRSLIPDEERQDISGLLSLLGGNTELTSANEVAGGKGKDGKGKDGKGKDGKGKGKEGKGGKGKEGKGKESAAESSILDILSNNLLGQIIQSVLGLLTGAVSSLNPLKSAMEPKTTTPPL